ncbi:hypothetical protein TpMuguga_01g02380 [Theileria parva strain Muguga]|uniref:uncharacterized protein n=1 Tax=Theileria parva strain Muguga TaxID=333668 RepID=UPI001C621739|nr:uncharacterized protein TpMuguga_01g02380 [Theileria parva strain Muguga]KAF5153412.1 hypothetical protein TpMuguga_01g02380 [Theileria parva strain Muguga]
MLDYKLEYKAELVNGLPVLYCKFGNDQDWNNITHLRCDIEKLSFTNLHRKKFTHLNCNNQLKDLLFTITFNCACSNVIYKDQLLWSYWVNPLYGYPIKLLFNLKSNTLTLLFKQNKLISLDIQLFNSANSVTDVDDGILEIENGFVEMIEKDRYVNSVETTLGLAWQRDPGEPFPTSVIYQGNNRVILVCARQFITCTFNGVQWTKNTTKTL